MFDFFRKMSFELEMVIDKDKCEDLNVSIMLLNGESINLGVMTTPPEVGGKCGISKITESVI